MNGQRESNLAEASDAQAERSAVDASDAATVTSSSLATVTDEATNLLLGDGSAAATIVSKPGSLEAGRELGTIRILSEIGHGAAGVVYLGQDTLLARSVAVKLLLHVDPDPDASGAAFHKFFEEARAAAAARHPHLRQIYSAGVVDGRPYLILEYIRGSTLRDVLKGVATPLGAGIVVDLMADVAEAVGELHDHGVIHRDLKPANLLVDEKGNVFVSDFGLAVRGRAGGAGAMGGADVPNLGGTPAFMAPEMFDGRISPRSDVYALGISTFQLLTGGLPFDGKLLELRRQHQDEPLPIAKLHEHRVLEALIQVIERACHKQHMFRFKTAADFASALRRSVVCDVTTLEQERKKLIDAIAGAMTPHDGVARPTSEASVQQRQESGASQGSSGLLASSGPADAYQHTLSRIAGERRERRAPAVRSDASASHPPGYFPAPVSAEGNVAYRTLAIAGIVIGLFLAITGIVGVGVVWFQTDDVLRAGVPHKVETWRITAGAITVLLSSAMVVSATGLGFHSNDRRRRFMRCVACIDLLFELLAVVLLALWVNEALAAAGRPTTLLLPMILRSALKLSFDGWVLGALRPNSGNRSALTAPP